MVICPICSIRTHLQCVGTVPRLQKQSAVTFKRSDTMKPGPIWWVFTNQCCTVNIRDNQMEGSLWSQQLLPPIPPGQHWLFRIHVTGSVCLNFSVLHHRKKHHAAIIFKRHHTVVWDVLSDQSRPRARKSQFNLQKWRTMFTELLPVFYNFICIYSLTLRSIAPIIFYAPLQFL